jgi:hypothetical protein
VSSASAMMTPSMDAFMSSSFLGLGTYTRLVIFGEPFISGSSS